MKAPKRSKIVGNIPGSRVEVPVSEKQRNMIVQADQALASAQQERNLVLNAIAAGVPFEGALNYEGIEARDGKFFLILSHPEGSKPEPPAAPAP